MPKTVIVSPAELHRMISETFQALGAPQDESDLIADQLVDADLRGVHSHGSMRLNVYPQRMKGGAVSPAANLKIERDTPSTALVDGGNGMGQVVSARAMTMALDKAAASGVGVVGAHHSNHFGAAAYIAELAIKRDMIGMVFTVSSVNVMAPWGGVDKLLGNNPLAIAAPAGKELPLLLDMAMSVAAVGKIKLASYTGEPIPEGWALDKYGQPTTDANEALEGLAAPLATYKGSGLAIMIAILAGVLTGGAVGSQVRDIFHDLSRPQNTAHLFIALNVEQFLPLDIFKTNVDAFIRELKSSNKARGVEEILMPGEREFLLREKRRQEGIPLNQEVFDQISQVAQSYGVTPAAFTAA